MSATTKQRIDVPASTENIKYAQLAYLEAHDMPLNLVYAFLAYRETNVSDGTWKVWIRSSQTAGASFEPDRIEQQARATPSGSHFKWGYSFDPSADDLRHIEFRVHVVDAKPVEIEMFAQLRKADGSSGEAKSVRFAWPA